MKRSKVCYYRLKLDTVAFLKWWIEYQIRTTGDFEPTTSSFLKKSNLRLTEISRARTIKGIGCECKFVKWAFKHDCVDDLFEKIYR